MCVRLTLSSLLVRFPLCVLLSFLSFSFVLRHFFFRTDFIVNRSYPIDIRVRLHSQVRFIDVRQSQCESGEGVEGDHEQRQTYYGAKTIRGDVTVLVLRWGVRVKSL